VIGTMETLLGLHELDRARPRVVTIGVFDGLHRGHRAVLERLVREARAMGAAATAVTFDPHPDAVLRGAPPPRLSDPEQLIEGIAALDIDEFVVQPFDQAFSRLEPEPFLRLLGAGEGLRAFLMTPDAAFGHRRRGDATTVAEIGERLGFRLVLVTPLLVAGRPVSSSRIREAIGAGRLAEARRLLGRSPSVTGRVIKGAGRGRDLGFPTANLAFDEPVALPPDGIYAVRVTWRRAPGEPWRSGAGVASLGVRPTFGPGERVLEVYLFGVKEPLYGATMRVLFERRQRGERRFATAAALVGQMTRDAARAKRILAG
jgi:riboflavin kinase/FMN adenylyltransferase